MIDTILRFSLQQRLLVLLATVILLGSGVWAMKKLPVDAFPDVTNVQVQILTQAGGMAPTEVVEASWRCYVAVKVTNGYFLVGLSAVDIDLQRNVQLLKERDWFDIPLVYTSGKRAILAVEKGTPGARAFEEAFRAWGQ